MKKFNPILRKFKTIFLIVCISLGSIISFSFVDDYFELSKNLDIFSTLFRELNMYYVDEEDPGKLMKKGVDAMLESLDPYTNFIPENEVEDFRFMSTGEYGGIGAGIRKRDDYVVITEPYDNYPAQKGDLRAGDVILEIDGKSAKGKRTDEVSKILKGPAKTTVRLLVSRDGEEKPIEKVLMREKIKIINVPYFGMLKNNTAYIRLSGFTENAGKEVKDALVALKTANTVKSVILDLRGNPGGLLNEAVNISNVFVNKGQEIVSTRGKVKDWDKVYKALNPPVDTEMPIAVLVNSGSASASEIVTGSIQDLDRGVVIGQRTYGKGLVQTTRPLSYNAQLKVTTAKYYTPSGRCIQALDYTHRNDDGSVGKIPDSLITPFKTHLGRIVYDGGGIAPDVVVPAKTYSSIEMSLLNKFLIFDFATKYKLKHASIAKAQEFKLTEADYNDFIAFISDKEYDYVSKSEKMLEDLKESAEKEKIFGEIKTEFDALKTRLYHNKKEDLKKFKEGIILLLTEEIVSRYYFQTGKIEAGLEADAEVKKALDVLKDKNLYESILNTNYKIPKETAEKDKNKSIDK